jgi:hypothetical protein
MICWLAMSPESSGREPALTASLQFVRYHWCRILGISAALLVPCFWHRHIEASDLGSHLYNAWLAQLIRRGDVPGLWLARQWTNVLFDLFLSGFGSLFGLHAAERFAVSLSILIFFWGAFAFVAAAARRAPWFLVPAIAIVTFGYTFHMGFFNFYLSLGFSFFGLAILWWGTPREWLAALVLVPLILVAHPIGMLWFAGAAAYIFIGERIPMRWHVVLFFAAVAALAAAHFYLTRHYITEAAPSPIYVFNGADQLLLFGDRYRVPALGVFIFGVAVLAVGFLRSQGGKSRGLIAIPFELYVLTLAAVPLLPRGITFGPDVAPIALLTERLTSVSAVLAIALMATMQPRKWHLAGSLAVAAVFFSFVYQDTARANRLEDQADYLVRTLPPGQRVLATIKPFAGSRILIQHMIDRACIGHCFSFGNYEPASNVFRVRATAGNPYALSDYDTSVSTEDGEYEVQPEDLPISEVYECGPGGAQLCIESLQPGEVNGRDVSLPGDE